jgi:hypothetical protein
MNLITATFLVLTLPLAEPETGTQVFESEKLALQARQSIARGNLMLKVKVYRKEELFSDWDVACWFDGRKIRNDTSYHLVAGSKSSVEREINALNCPKDGFFLEWVRTYEQGPLCQLRIRQMKTQDSPENNALYDPRLFGMLSDPPGTWWRLQLDDTVGRTKRRGASIKKGDWKGQTCWQIQYEGLSERASWQTRISIVPSWGYSVVRIEKESDGVSDSLENEIQRFEDTDVWFPKHSEFVRLVNGKESDREVYEIQVQSLNRPIDPRAFQLEGMDIPIRTPVQIPEDSMHLHYWDGAKIVKAEYPAEFMASLHDELEQKPPKKHNWWWVAGALVLACAAAYLIWRALPNSRSVR